MDFFEIYGVKCLVKNPSRKNIVMLYQDNVRTEIDKYLSLDRISDSKKKYIELLQVNVKNAPFALGWLNIPEKEDDYRLIKGFITIEEIEKKNLKKATTKKKASKKQSKKN